MSTLSRLPITAPGSADHAFRFSFEKTGPLRARLLPAALLPVNLDSPLVVTTVLGSVPRLGLLRGTMAALLVESELAPLDDLEVLAEALAFAHVLCLSASSADPTLPRLLERASSLREHLVTDAAPLARRGLLDGKRLDELKGGPGYLNTGSDVGVLAQLFRERWSEISSITAVKVADLDEAEALFEQITRAYAARDQQAALETAAAEERQRAYTLVVQAYDQARRVVSYVRWKEGDADKVTPSLWAGRGGRGSSASEAPKPGEDEAPAAGAAHTPKPGAAEGNGPAPVNGAAPATGAPVPVGFPGSSPFAT